MTALRVFEGSENCLALEGKAFSQCAREVEHQANALVEVRASLVPGSPTA